MMAMQTSNYNVFAEMVRPIFLNNVNENELNPDEKKYLEIFKDWNLNNDVNEKGPTVFEILWNQFYHVVYDDEYARAPKNTMKPFESTLLEAVLKDSAYKFLDNINTAGTETLANDVTLAFKNASVELSKVEQDGKLEWAKYKDTHVSHLTKLEPLSDLHLPIGGGTYCINAAKGDHGPSWRMIVSLTANTEAYGVYPGGQNGNPGSKYYDNFVSKWVKGEYYSLWMMKQSDAKSPKVKWTMTMNNQ